MTPRSPDPFFLLDESLSSGIVAEVSKVTGFHIATVWDEWPGRNLSVNRLRDEEIISHLGYRAGHRAVWITGDRKAFDEHGDLIDSHRISVLWLRGPGCRPPLEPGEQSQMLSAVMERVHSLILVANDPVYLRVRLDPGNHCQPFLERLWRNVLHRPIEWQRVGLD